MTKAQIAGIVIFALIIAVGSGIYFFGDNLKPVEVVSGYVGGEKIPYLKNEEVQKILKNKYGLEIDYTKAGSIEMAREDVSHLDFIFPSSQIALEIFKNENSDSIKKSEVIFSSPIVLYSWKPIADALVKEGMATNIEGIYYSVDMKAFSECLTKETKWEEIGVDIYGKVKIISTDPSKSNSGNMYSGLLLNTLNGDVAGMGELNTLMPQINAIFDDLGFMESSSGTLFDRYLVRGIGDSPMIAGYESQIVQFAIDNPDKWAKLKDDVAVIYPEPTVWSEHPLIALNDKGEKLIHALMDEELQRISYEKHGFRTINAPASDSVTFPENISMPDGINQIMPMPKADVMEALIDELSK